MSLFGAIAQHYVATAASGVVQSKPNSGSATGAISAVFDATPTNGNILVCSIASANNGTQTGPSGWTQVFNGTMGTTPGGANERWGLWWKVAGASESTTVSGSLSTSSRWSMVVVELAANALDTSVLTSAQTSLTPTATGFTTATADRVLVIFCGAPVATETPTYDDGFASVVNAQATNATNGSGLYVAFKDVATSTATGTVTATFGHNQSWRGTQIGFTAI